MDGPSVIQTLRTRTVGSLITQRPISTRIFEKDLYSFTDYLNATTEEKMAIIESIFSHQIALFSIVHQEIGQEYNYITFDHDQLARAFQIQKKIYSLVTSNLIYKHLYQIVEFVDYTTLAEY